MVKEGGKEFVHNSGTKRERKAEISHGCKGLSGQRCPCTPLPFTNKTLINSAIENHINTFLNNYCSQQRNDVILLSVRTISLALTLYTTKAKSDSLTDGNKQALNSW